ncbi:MAG: FtsW/RodA/SpoVE family cell cycle protein [Bacteroidetes bacterium]|nr:FtsW/RodA/SpoVE family cell cycle protein [Bacteroidota bacterium]
MTEKKKIASMDWLVSRTKGDMVIWMIVILLSLFSMLAVYSSTSTIAYKYQAGNTEYYLFKHLGLMALGLMFMYGAHTINYKYYSRIAQILLIVSIPLLFATYFISSSINQAHRWITLPVINVSFQTSDLAKLALIMFVARMLSKKQDVITDFKKATLPIMSAVFVICGLIAPANLSTALLLFGTCLMLMFIGRMSLKHIFFILGGFGLALGIFIFLAHQIGKSTGHPIGRVETWISRVDHYLNDKDETIVYQNQQANIAIASGGLVGKGPGKSIQKNFLPNPYADFIFAIVIEEYGTIGGIILMVLYLTLLYRSIRIVLYSPKAFGALLAVGLSFSLVLQAFINMGVAVHLFPVTGLTLPLVSMGGTSLWFTSLAFGIILSVSRDIEEKENLENVENWVIAN